MPSRNQSSCSQLWFCRSRSWGGRHGQADQRVAAADLHGCVHRERHIRRNSAPLSRRANLIRAVASFVGIAFAVLAACPFRKRAEKRAAGNGPASCRFRPHRRRSRGRPCARRGRYRTVLRGVHMVADGDRTAWLRSESYANVSLFRPVYLWKQGFFC